MQNNSESVLETVPEEITKLQDLDINEEEEDRYIDEDEEDILRKIEELSSQENNTSLDFGTNEHPRVLDILLEAYETFPNLRKLTDLNLTNNWLGGSSLSIELLEFLKLFPNLVSLNLDWNDFSSVSNVCKCSVRLSEGDSRACLIKTGCTKDQTLNLKNLSIHGCYINVIRQNSYNIIGFLERFPKLVSLKLGDNGLDDKWMKRFEPVLEQCHDLAELNLNSNEIGPEGAKILANVLQGSNFIRLHLFGNNIGAEGAKYIAQVLAQCPNLAELILSMNNIGDEGASYIANALVQSVQCPKLATLDLSSNNISDEGAKSFEKVLCNAQCSSLTDLNLDHNNISEEAAKRLKEKLSQSHNLVLKELLLEYQSPA
jgi:hypothetical protein